MEEIKIECFDIEIHENELCSPKKESESPSRSESISPQNEPETTKRKRAASDDEHNGLVTLAGSKQNGGRPTLSFIRKYFIYDKETNTSKCNIENCCVVLKGQHSPTLERHVSRFHPVEKIAISLERKRRLKDTENVIVGSSDLSASSSMSTEGETSLKKKKQHITIVMNEQILKTACTQLVTVDGHPLSIMRDSGLRLLIDPIIAALNAGKPGYQKITVNRSNIRMEVQEEAKIIRSQIQMEVKGRLVCLKLDTAAHLDRQVLGISIQFIHDNKIKLRTLCIKELLANHTAEFLKTEIMKVLREFGISPAMIYTVTLDNASNLLRTDRHRSDDESSSGDESEEESVMATLNSDTVVLNACKDISRLAVVSVRCAAQTLQLAISDVLKRNKVKEALSQARNLAGILRTPLVKERLKAAGLNKPSLDCVTRWQSSHDMVASLLPLKQFCHEDYLCIQAQVTDSMWNEFEEFVRSLQPAKIASKRLQCEQLTAGDCFEIWLRCQIQTGKIKLEIASDLCSAMSNRGEAMLECKAFLGALYLDPRFHTILNLQQRERAETYLESVWLRILRLKETSASSDDEDDFEAFLRSRETASEEETNIRLLLQYFHQDTPRSKSSVRNPFNVLEYWRSREKGLPQLNELAKTILALPTTQVSVDCLVSHLKQTLSILRYNLRSEMMNDILIVKCNRLLE